jgi:hypothetical protein
VIGSGCQPPSSTSSRTVLGLVEASFRERRRRWTTKVGRAATFWSRTARLPNWRHCWAAELAGPVRPEHEAAKASAAWPAAGAASNGRALLVDPHFEFGDANAEMQQWSTRGRVGRLQVIEQERFSHATLWADGKIAWEVSYEAELDDRPLTTGQFPYDLDALAAGIGSPDDPQTWYQVPAEAFRLATNWQPCRGDDRDQPPLIELRYPRPAGIGASVARDLAND